MVFRSLKFKLAVVLVSIALVPMLAVSLFVYFTARDSMTKSSVGFFVARVARDTSHRLDFMAERMSRETRIVSWSPYLVSQIDEWFANRGVLDVRRAIQRRIQSELNHGVRLLEYADLFLVVDRSGRVLISSNIARPTLTGRFSGAAAGAVVPRFLWSEGAVANPHEDVDLTDRPWWKAAEGGLPTTIDCGYEPLVLQPYGYEIYSDTDVAKPDLERLKNPEAFSFGFTVGIPTATEDPDDPGGTNQVQAILVAFYNWSAVQDILDQVNDEFVNYHPQYTSGYTFLFRSDMDTIIGHKYRQNYLSELVANHHLPELHREMAESGGEDVTLEYDYRGSKISGVSQVRSTGWWLGFGINKTDIYVEVAQLRSWLVFGALFLAGIVLILSAIASRRIMKPIKGLITGTNEIARGNLDARVELGSNDELALVADAFNTMAENLKLSNKRLIAAEKTAAWQEMARQVAHEIKNPLTPIKLSAQLIQRAHVDHHPDLERIVSESVENIVSQTDSLKRIAANFAAYSTFPRADRKPLSIRRLVADSVRLYSHEQSSGIEVVLESFIDDDVLVMADADELKRVFLNLFNNAFEAMPEGGKLTVGLLRLAHEKLGDVVRIATSDTGGGITSEIRQRLFEPYFTTRSSGTGLGLAIAKKTVTSSGGTIEILAESGQGVTVVIHLPVVTDPPVQGPPA